MCCGGRSHVPQCFKAGRWVRIVRCLLGAPCVRQVQETLVANGDKPAKFVGSKEWIGAFECNLVLDVCFGVTCKIIAVTSGAHLAEKGHELALHFKQNGTPIMVTANPTYPGPVYTKSHLALIPLAADPTSKDRRATLRLEHTTEPARSIGFIRARGAGRRRRPGIYDPRHRLQR